MKNKRQPLEEEQTLFSAFEIEAMEQETPKGHDKILEVRQRTNFDDKQLSEQEHVQLVEKAVTPESQTEEAVRPNEETERQIYPIDMVKAAAKEYFDKNKKIK